VLVQFAIVLMRYVFGVSHVFVQESVVYMHAVLFMVAVGYTLLHNGHVRVDIFYSAASAKRKALIDFLGVWLFIAPMVAVTWHLSWPYVAFAWRVREGSPEGSGIPAVFLLKSLILVFAVLLAIQGIALAIRSLLVMAGVERKAVGEQRIQL
jgi:TRAP-type mannitol/chloroaromatic compound transport system permease small subunit